MNDQEKHDLNITRKAIDAGIDFVCDSNGDKIACKYLVRYCIVCLCFRLLFVYYKEMLVESQTLNIV